MHNREIKRESTYMQVGTLNNKPVPKTVGKAVTINYPLGHCTHYCKKDQTGFLDPSIFNTVLIVEAIKQTL